MNMHANFERHLAEASPVEIEPKNSVTVSLTQREKRRDQAHRIWRKNEAIKKGQSPKNVK